MTLNTAEARKGKFKVLIRSSNTARWNVYGEFASEQEWQRELPHIQFLQSMGPVYLKREWVSLEDAKHAAHELECRLAAEAYLREQARKRI